VPSTHIEGEIRHEASRTEAPLSVTIIAHDLGSVGGMERQLEDLVLGLRRRGHEVTVIARTCELPESAGVAFHRVRTPRRPFLLAYPLFMVAGSLAVRRWRRGVVQATGAIVLNRVDVVSVHYCHQVGPAHPSRSTRLYRAQVRAVGWLARIGERYCFRANRAAAFVCVSDGVAEDMRTYYPDLAERITTIHNGVDTDRFAPGAREEQARARRDSLNIGEEQLVALFVGGEWERKGLEPAIQALSLASDWILLIAGGGEQSRYRRLGESLGVAESTRWLGVTPDVQLLYQLADVFLLPSSYEAFSIATLEAAASGLPMLVTPVNGARELIEDGQNGFLIGQEPDEIAARLNHLAGDSALRERLGKAARESALKFDAARMVEQHCALYERLASVVVR
jgi:UDP-glucose:(heptosyl)LPS alpha-1,3-glucosyltransferase